MQFAIRAYDGEHVLERRMAVRARHLENLSKVQDHILCSGGLLDAQGSMYGSLLIMDMESREQLDAYLNDEPYLVEKVWERVEIEAMNVVVLNGKKIGV